MEKCQKCRYFYNLESFFIDLGHRQILFGVYFEEKPRRKKFLIFDKNHGLTLRKSAEKKSFFKGAMSAGEHAL